MSADIATASQPVEAGSTLAEHSCTRAVSIGVPPPWLARVTGVLYLALAVLGMFAGLTLESVLVPGDATATAGNLERSTGQFTASLVVWLLIVMVDVALAVALYLLLAPAGRGLALLAAAFRLAFSAALGSLLVHQFTAYELSASGGSDPVTQGQALAALQSFATGFLVALVIFGVHLVLLGTLLVRSRCLPRILGILVVAAGAGYIADSLASLMMDGYGGLVAAIPLTAAVVGELSLTFWLLLRGITIRER